MKLCKDCKHFDPQAMGGASQCLASGNHPNPDFLHGGPPKPVYTAAQACRIDASMCGPDAKWFEARQTEVRAAA